ncbi:hypothetical protein A7J50_6045 (plasmid) [Pseudomonas antarctica]|uniref:Uncharacterized protein n=1 Tax=Pseudomonas antarctica TaxID=219572 RepID=A0A172Z9Y8_9PSED|nr:hypothetical protein [Pseudomonas antarctica]ANF89333.1 hypothetical protein A7J50_6045 [Pseudomonas antarctica]
MSANEELVVTSLNEIIETSCQVGIELKPYAVNAASLFLIELNASGTIDQTDYALLANKLNTDGMTDASKRKLQNTYRKELFGLIVEAANLEMSLKTLGADNGSEAKLFMESEMSAFIHHAHYELQEDGLKQIEYDFFLNWVDSVVYPS